MYTYTTPTITCSINGIELSQVDYIRLALGAGKATPVVKTVNSEDIGENGTFSVKLTQEETAELGPVKIRIQARIIYKDGTVQATNKVVSSLDDVLDKVVV